MGSNHHKNRNGFRLQRCCSSRHKWKLGIKFGEDKALSMENAYLSKGLLLAQELQTSDLKAQSFFAVLEGFKIEFGIENQMDVTLLCK